MPRHRTPHWSDGPVKRWHDAPPDVPRRVLRGDALQQRLAVLRDEANTHHGYAVQAWASAVDAARAAGDALLEVKRRLGHKLKWSQWRRENFDGSIETAKVYARIAREWDCPRMQAARAAGIRLDSLRAVLDVISGRRTPERPKRQDRKPASAAIPESAPTATDILRVRAREKLSDLLDATGAVVLRALMRPMGADRTVLEVLWPQIIAEVNTPARRQLQAWIDGPHSDDEAPADWAEPQDDEPVWPEDCVLEDAPAAAGTEGARLGTTDKPESQPGQRAVRAVDAT